MDGRRVGATRTLHGCWCWAGAGAGAAGRSRRAGRWAAGSRQQLQQPTAPYPAAAYSLCQAQPGVRVVSNSYQSDCQGTPCYSQLEFDAIQALGAEGALFVVAAGNSACMNACCDAR